MGFKVIENEIRTMWVPLAYSDTVYEGAIVHCGLATPADDGVVPIGAPSGASSTTNKYVPYGVVVAMNNATTLYNATYGAYATSVQSQAAQLARDWRGTEGIVPKGDPRVMVQIAVIGPHTVLQGPICNAAYGTAPGVDTVTTGSTTGAGYTASAADFTPVAYNATHYCRSGANKGLQRTGTDTSTTVHTVNTYFPYDIAVGDTFCVVNLKEHGTCRAYIDTEGTYFDNSAALTTNYYLIQVLELDLRAAGKETCTFTFNMDQFCGARA